MAEIKDRKVGLIVFGVVQLLIGAMAALAIPMMIFSIVASSKLAAQSPEAPQFPMKMMVPSVIVYLLMAIFFITLGVGSILARRWARALSLIVSWWWLLMGAVSVVAMAVVMPMFFSSLGKAGGGPSLPGGAEVVMMLVMLGILSFFYVIIPGAFVLFYRSPHVLATCERLDPKPRWTDACPLPVLGVALMFAMSACFMPTMGCYGWVLPFFGRFLHGIPGAAASLLIACCSFLIALAAYRLKPAAWWGMLVMVLVWGASTCVTFQTQTLAEMYKVMGIPMAGLEILGTAEPFSTIVMACTVLGCVAFATYLFFIRRYFVAVPPRIPGAP